MNNDSRAQLINKIIDRPSSWAVILLAVMVAFHLYTNFQFVGEVDVTIKKTNELLEVIIDNQERDREIFDKLSGDVISGGAGAVLRDG